MKQAEGLFAHQAAMATKKPPALKCWRLFYGLLSGQVALYLSCLGDGCALFCALPSQGGVKYEFTDVIPAFL